MAHFLNLTNTVRRLTSRGGLGGLTLLALSAAIILEASRMHFWQHQPDGPGLSSDRSGGVFWRSSELALMVEGWNKPEDRIDVGPLAPPALLLSAIIAFAVLYEFAGAFSIDHCSGYACRLHRTLAAQSSEWLLLPLGICLGIWLLFGVCSGPAIELLSSRVVAMID